MMSVVWLVVLLIPRTASMLPFAPATGLQLRSCSRSAVHPFMTDDRAAEELLQQFLEDSGGDIAADMDELSMLHRFLDDGGSITDVDESGFALEFESDEDEELSEAATTQRAANEEAALKDAPPLALTGGVQASEVLDEQGVVRLGGALSATTADAMREYVLGELGRFRKMEAEDGADGDFLPSCGAVNDRFSSVLAPFGTDSAAGVRRYDMRLTLDPIVRSALHELLAGDVGAALEAVAGADAELYELAALIATPGASAQPLHADTLWSEEGCLYTSFVALQQVRREMGPTRFVRGTHSSEASHRAFDNGMADGTFLDEYGDRAACGLLDAGEATLYDGRLLHGGSANVCRSTTGDAASGGSCGATNPDVRVLFYVTFRRAGTDADELANDEAHSILEEYRSRFRLGELRTSAARV